METRKVQLAGNSTYTISLPKAWAEEQGIETGMELRLRPRDGRLVLETESAADPPVPVVDVTDRSAAEVREVVRGMYALGYDAFDLRTDGELSPAVRRSVSETATALAGLEVEADDGRTVRCRDLLDASALSVSRVVPRLRFAALSAHRRATDAFVEGYEDRDGDGDGDATDVVERVEGHRRDASAEAALLERCFQRTLPEFADPDGLGVSRAELSDHLRVAGDLERVAAGAVDIARAADGDPLSPPAAESFADRARRVRESIELTTDATLSDGGIDEALDARRRSRHVVETVEALADADEAPPTRSWSLGVAALRRTADCAATIGAHALRSALRREA